MRMTARSTDILRRIAGQLDRGSVKTAAATHQSRADLRRAVLCKCAALGYGSRAEDPLERSASNYDNLLHQQALRAEAQPEQPARNYADVVYQQASQNSVPDFVYRRSDGTQMSPDDVARMMADENERRISEVFKNRPDLVQRRPTEDIAKEVGKVKSWGDNPRLSFLGHDVLNNLQLQWNAAKGGAENIGRFIDHYLLSPTTYMNDAESIAKARSRQNAWDNSNDRRLAIADAIVGNFRDHDLAHPESSRLGAWNYGLNHAVGEFGGSQAVFSGAGALASGVAKDVAKVTQGLSQATGNAITKAVSLGNKADTGLNAAGEVVSPARTVAQQVGGAAQRVMNGVSDVAMSPVQAAAAVRDPVGLTAKALGGAAKGVGQTVNAAAIKPVRDLYGFLRSPATRRYARAVGRPLWDATKAAVMPFAHALRHPSLSGSWRYLRNTGAPLLSAGGTAVGRPLWSLVTHPGTVGRAVTYPVRWLGRSGSAIRNIADRGVAQAGYQMFGRPVRDIYRLLRSPAASRYLHDVASTAASGLKAGFSPVPSAVANYAKGVGGPLLRAGRAGIVRPAWLAMRHPVRSGALHAATYPLRWGKGVVTPAWKALGNKTLWNNFTALNAYNSAARKRYGDAAANIAAMGVFNAYPWVGVPMMAHAAYSAYKNYKDSNLGQGYPEDYSEGYPEGQ